MKRKYKLPACLTCSSLEPSRLAAKERTQVKAQKGNGVGGEGQEDMAGWLTASAEVLFQLFYEFYFLPNAIDYSETFRK